MKPKIYVETSIISYLTANRSRDMFVGSNQILAMEWWNDYRRNFDSYVSKIVVDEVGRGDPAMAKKRLDAIVGLPLLEVNEKVILLAEKIY